MIFTVGPVVVRQLISLDMMGIDEKNFSSFPSLSIFQGGETHQRAKEKNCFSALILGP